jgi:hypothetical protein
VQAVSENLARSAALILMLVNSWLLFFHRRQSTSPWWCRYLHRDFAHVTAAAFDPRIGVWVFVDPMSSGLLLEIVEPADATPRLTAWFKSSSAVIEVSPGHQATFMPIIVGCTGAIKGLLGRRVGAWTPRQLYHQLQPLARIRK